MSEKNLIKDYMLKNELDIEEIMKNYTPYIYTILKNRNVNLTNEDIEEIISDVFLAVWKNQNKLNINKEISPYLVGITKNLYNKKIRNKKDVIDIDNYQNILTETESIEIKIENTEKEKLIMFVVNNMKQEDKDIFILYYYNSRTMKEIANILSITEKKVKSRLFRIRQKVKKFLEKRGYTNNGEWQNQSNYNEITNENSSI